MRIAIILLAGVTILFALAGCGDDECATCPRGAEQPLAEIEGHLTIGTSAAIGDTMNVSYFSTSAETLFFFRVSPADVGDTWTVSASTYPPFAAAAERLSDGVDDMWSFQCVSPEGFGGSNQKTESFWLGGGLTGRYSPDLHGAEITKIRFLLDEMNIIRVPGYTTVNVEARAVIIGRP